MASENIILSREAEEIGLAVMLKELLDQNLAQSPHKLDDFRRLNMGFALIVTDAELELTMVFQDGTLTIHGGSHPEARVHIAIESGMVLAMSNLRIKNGLPYYFDETGREVLTAIFTRKLRIRGMLRHFPSMVRLSRVLSIH